MSCDLNDPAIKQAYEEIRGSGPAMWFVAGYKETKDVITLYKKSATNFNDLKQYVNTLGEVLYIYIKIESKIALITFISEKITGVKRARALVHGRMVNGAFKDNNTFWTVTSSAEFTEESLRRQLRLDVDTMAKKPSTGDLRQTEKKPYTTELRQPPVKEQSTPSIQSTRPAPVSQSILDLNAREDALFEARPSSVLDRNVNANEKTLVPNDQTLVSSAEEETDDYSPSDIYGDYKTQTPKAPVTAEKSKPEPKIKEVEVKSKPQVDSKVESKAKSDVKPKELVNELKTKIGEKPTEKAPEKPKEISKGAIEAAQDFNKHGQFYAQTKSNTWVLRSYMVTKGSLLLFNENNQPPKLVREISLDKLSAITPTSDEILIKNSFKLVFEGGRTDDDCYFYCDSAEQMGQLVNRILARV